MPEHQGEAIETHQVGPHLLEVERPDIVHIHYSGDIEPAHFDGFHQIIAILPPPTPVYLLRDARNGGTHTRGARALAARDDRASRLAAIVTYGSSFHARTVITMLNKGVRMLKPYAPETVFFETEEEARAWIAEHRAQSK